MTSRMTSSAPTIELPELVLFIAKVFAEAHFRYPGDTSQARRAFCDVLSAAEVGVRGPMLTWFPSQSGLTHKHTNIS
jgi:hypothetical protein